MLSRVGLPATCALLLGLLAVAQEPPSTPVGDLFASDASVKGAVQLANTGMQVMSGSSIQAGQATALLRLRRGGDVRICPRTAISLSSSHNGRDLMFGMNAGAMEAHYDLAASADVIMTPDFRILLAGPGKFHVAVGNDARGNTCVRPLADNSASVIVSELMGDGTYQVKPDQQVMFQDGKLADASRVVGDCGCPAPAPVKRAEAVVPALPDIASLRQHPPQSLALPLDEPAPPASASPALPPPPADEVHVEVDAPFVFRATDPVPSPAPRVAHLKFPAAAPWPLIPQPPPPPELQQVAAVQPLPEAQAPPAKKKFFGRVRAFFASIFR